jgi:hypothetical protein
MNPIHSETNDDLEKPPYCPSAQPDWDGSVVLGVISGDVKAPQVAYLDQPHPVTPELLERCEPVNPAEVFRFAAPCAGNGCQHFDGQDCRLVEKVVRLMPTAVDTLPPCHLRPDCQWWQQSGRSACVRCPQIVTENYYASEALRQAADPSVV